MHDVIVIGGGPGGSSAATVLAQQGFRTLLLEKERFPRFQIGESLLPYNNSLFERLGVLDLLSDESYHPKYGAHFVTGDGSVGHVFRFDRTLPEKYGRSIQVERARFDHALLRNAATHGVEVREEWTVRSCDLSNPDRAVVVATAPDGTEHTLESRFVIDASGHRALVGATQGERQEAKDLRKIAFFAHYRGLKPAGTGRNAGNTIIVILKNAWIWMIPINREVTSVGVVVDRDEYQRCGLTPEAVLERTLANGSFAAERMESAERVTPVMARKDFSYRMKDLSGPNYALVGDAAGFIDPIFSTGVFIAMKSGEMAADAATQRLRTGSEKELRRYAARLGRALDKYLMMIRHFYEREFLEIFLQPSERFGLRSAVIGVLAGNIFEAPRDRLKLALFFGLVAIQRFRGGIAPPIGWDELPEMARA